MSSLCHAVIQWCLGNNCSEIKFSYSKNPFTINVLHLNQIQSYFWSLDCKNFALFWKNLKKIYFSKNSGLIG